MFEQKFQQCKESHKSLCTLFMVLFCLFLIVLIIFFLASIQNKIKQGIYIGKDIESRNTISVTGTGEIYAKPDLGLISFSVITEAKTVSEALNENSEKMNQVIDSIKSQGVEDKDLKTTSFYIYPRYEYREGGTYSWPSGNRVLVGYEITQQLEVKIRELDKTGQIIEGAASAGANQVGSLSFIIENADDIKKQARGEAIEEAKEKAKELAGQLDVKLVRITSFSDSSLARVYSYQDYAEAMPLGIGGGAAPEIETGENKISVTVSITYEID